MFCLADGHGAVTEGYVAIVLHLHMHGRRPPSTSNLAMHVYRAAKAYHFWYLPCSMQTARPQSIGR
jgi:hypothetical protein